MQRLPIKDDNLHLILSKGHDKWLDNEIRDRWIAVFVLLIVLGFAASWGIAQIEEDTGSPRVVYVDINESVDIIKAYEDDGYTVIRGKSETVKGEEAGDAVLSNPHLVPGVMALISLLILLIAGKALLEIRTLRQWRVEHHEFLKSYNRAVD